MTGPQSPFDSGPYPQNDPFAGHSGFGQPGPSYYPPPPQYSGGPPLQPPPPGRPPRDHTQWIIAGTAAAVVVALLVGLLVWKLVNRPSAGSQTQASTATAAPLPSAATPPPTGSSTPAAPQSHSCKGRSAGPGPHTPSGWSTVLSPRGLAYDVPPGWEVNDCTTLMGWEKKCPDGPFGSCPIRMMSGTADLPDPACKKNSLATTGVPGAKISDINQAAAADAALAKDIYTSDSGAAPSVALSAPKTLTIDGSPAVEIVATVTNIVTEGCGASRALHVIVATTVPGQDGSVLFLASLEQGNPGDPGPEVADQLVSSLRHAG